jgi:DNA-binding SARP family transcriptional activator/Tfp pilus assembly protein PilF
VDHVQVRLLGTVDATVGGVVRPVAGLRRKAVLATLGLAAGEVVSVTRLMDVVWGDLVPPTAANTLQSHVSFLRRVLGSPTAVVARGRGYALDLGAEATDLLVAERLIRDGRQSIDPSRSAEQLQAALALWRGQPLAEVAGLPGLRGPAERLANLRMEAEYALIEVRLALGEHAALLPELERVTQEHPFHEQLHAQLMLALYRTGRQADALAAYRRLRGRLGEELGIDPSLHLRELEAAILRQDAGLQPPSPAVRLPAAPPPAAEVVPAQLPATVDGFVGRAAQLDRLDAFLAAALAGDGMPTLVIAAIEGTAGVGKTSLAVHWAHRVRDRFPDGQLYLNLRGYATSPPVHPAQALAQFLRALGVPDERVPLDLDEAAANYRTLLADRRMLVVLDNAASPEQVRPLLPGSPRCVVLVTSRDRLGGLVVSDGARLLDLDVLNAEEALALLAQILGESRAGQQPQAAAELARLCGCLPLALRIAAANLVGRPRVSVAQYVAELHEGNRLAGLEVDGDESLAVRAAFDLSYAALKPVERNMFRLLGLVPGPDLDTLAAASLAGTDPQQARRTLLRLVDRHLLTESAPGRFTLHDLLRHYARSLADAEDGQTGIAAAIHRLSEFFLDATSAAADLLYLETVRLPAPPAPARPRSAAPFADHTQALAWLDTERANLVALVHATAAHGPRPAAWQLADNLRGYFHLRRHLDDYLAVAGSAVRAAQGQPAPLASAHLSFGAAHNAQGHTGPAIAHFTTALTLAEQAGWPEGQAAALNNLGMVHSQTGRHRQAAPRFTQAAEVFARAGRLIGQAICLDNLGIVRRELGELEPAAALHQEAIRLHRQTGFPLAHATALTNLAAVYHDLGRLDEARRHYSEALALHRQTGNRDRQAICLYGMAELHCSTGRHEESVGPARQALTLAQEIGDRRTEANATMTLATIEEHQRQYASALDRYRHAWHLAEQTDSRYLKARALVGVARAQHGLEHTDDALDTVQEALALIRDGGYRKLEVDALTTLARIHTAQGRPDQAAAPAREALMLCQRTGYVPDRH